MNPQTAWGNSCRLPLLSRTSTEETLKTSSSNCCCVLTAPPPGGARLISHGILTQKRGTFLKAIILLLLSLQDVSEEFKTFGMRRRWLDGCQSSSLPEPSKASYWPRFFRGELWLVWPSKKKKKTLNFSRWIGIHAHIVYLGVELWISGWCLTA